jgi:hypothetical protein
VQVTDRRNKHIVTALREIAGGKVRFMTPEEAQAYEERKALEVEAARAAQVSERERKMEIGAGLFNNSDETRSIDFLRETLMQPGPIAAGDDDDDGEGEE